MEYFENLKIADFSQDMIYRKIRIGSKDKESYKW